MSNSIAKFTLDEKIRLSYIKHRGNLIAVAQELDVPTEYVRKIGKKLKYRNKRDADYLVAQTVMMHLLEGYQQRIAYLNEALNRIHNKDAIHISNCCKAIIDTINNKTICMLCKQECKPIWQTSGEIQKLRIDLIKQLRAEDAALANFAEKMGYSNNEPAPVYKQNVVVLGRNDNRKHIDNSEVIDSETQKRLSDLKPIDREKMRKQLEQEIIGMAEEKE